MFITLHSHFYFKRVSSALYIKLHICKSSAYINCQGFLIAAHLGAVALLHSCSVPLEKRTI